MRAAAFAIVTKRGRMITHDGRCPIFWYKRVAELKRADWGFSEDDSSIVKVVVQLAKGTVKP